MFAIALLVVFGLVILSGLAATLFGQDETQASGIAALVIGALLFGSTWVISSAFYVEAREVAIVHE